MTRTNLGEIISKFLQGKKLVNFELMIPSFYAKHRAWFCILRQNCQLYPEVEIGMIITWDVIYTGSVSEVTDEWSIDQERRGGRLNLPGQNRRSTLEGGIDMRIIWDVIYNWSVSEVTDGWSFSPRGKEEKDSMVEEWIKRDLSEFWCERSLHRGPKIDFIKVVFPEALVERLENRWEENRLPEDW